MRHLDPSFTKNRLKKSPEAAGKNFMSLICCNYWLVKTFAEPFLNTSHTVQTCIHGSTECMHRCNLRFNCVDNRGGIDEEQDQDNDLEYSSKYEDERKGRGSSSGSIAFYPLSSTWLSKVLSYIAIFLAYTIILCFIYASFTVWNSIKLLIGIR